MYIIVEYWPWGVGIVYKHIIMYSRVNHWQNTIFMERIIKRFTNMKNAQTNIQSRN